MKMIDEVKYEGGMKERRNNWIDLKSEILYSSRKERN